MDKINPIPIEMKNKQINGNGKSNIVNLTEVPVMIKIMATAIKENNRFTKEEIVLEIGNIYFGSLTFFIKAPPLKIDCIA